MAGCRNRSGRFAKCGSRAGGPHTYGTQPKWPVTIPYEVGSVPVSGDFAAWLSANAARWDTRRMPRAGASWLIVETMEGPSKWGRTETVALRFHGFRSLSAVKQEGFGVRTRLSLGGKTRSAIDYNVLFSLPGGKLLSVPMMAVVG